MSCLNNGTCVTEWLVCQCFESLKVGLSWQAGRVVNCNNWYQIDDVPVLRVFFLYSNGFRKTYDLLGFHNELGVQWSENDMTYKKQVKSWYRVKVVKW